MQWSLMWWLNNRTEEEIKKSIILVGLTGEARVSWFDPNYEVGMDDPWNNYLHSTWLEYSGPNVDEGWHQLKKYHITMSACGGLSQLNYDTALRMFDGVSARYEIPVIQFNTVATSDGSKVQTYHDLKIRELLDGACYASGGHPNERGHQKISEKLRNIVDKFI